SGSFRHAPASAQLPTLALHDALPIFKDPGKPGEKIVFTRVIKRNGEEVGREVIDERIVREAEPKIVIVGGKEPPNSAVWDKLASCERSEEHTSELQSREKLVCRLLLEKKQ